MAGTKGVDVYLKVNTGTEASPVWTKIGAQRDATFTREGELIEVTSKDSGGWEEKIAGNKNWSFEFESLLVENDAGLVELENAFINGTVKQYQIITPTHTYQGSALVESLEIEAPVDDIAVVSFTLTGTGPLTKI